MTNIAKYRQPKFFKKILVMFSRQNTLQKSIEVR